MSVLKKSYTTVALKASVFVLKEILESWLYVVDC